MPAQPPNACKPRNIINEFTEVAKAQPIDATRYIERPTYIGLFRPNLSSSGPYNNCPAEIPIKKLDRDNITFATLVCRLLAMSGKAGKYMSMEKGPMAVSKPNMRMRKNFLLGLLLSIITVIRQIYLIIPSANDYPTA